MSDPGGTLVTDASVAINIAASGRAPQVVAAVPGRIAVPRKVLRELEKGLEFGRTSATTLHGLIDRGLVEETVLGEMAEDLFDSLRRIIEPTTPGIGESATIACAVETGGIPVLDDEDAREIYENQYPGRPMSCSVELFARPEVEGALGRETLAHAVYCALTRGDMHVLDHDLRWVVELIGMERALTCRSIRKSRLLELERDPEGFG